MAFTAAQSGVVLKVSNGIGLPHLSCSPKLVRRGLIDHAVAVFQFNVELYPDVANTWDSLGEGYMTKGDNEKAIGCYRKALELDPEFENPKVMLSKLGVAVDSSH